jgi:Mrp family chromosome partitioning ATPase
VSKIYKALERAEAERTTDTEAILHPLADDVEDGHEVELPGRREEYEKLKVMLTLEAKRSELRTVMLVSALPGEGVTTVALGLAASMVEVARQGVLLVDLAGGDDTALTDRLGAQPRHGLGEALAKELSVREVIVETQVPSLSLLGWGRRPADFSQPETLALLEDLFKGLRAEFDFILVDGGSLRSVPDSLLVSSRVDGVVLVVQAERTGADAVREASRDLRAAGARLLGVVLNRRRQYLPGFLSKRI